MGGGGGGGGGQVKGKREKRFPSILVGGGGRNWGKEGGGGINIPVPMGGGEKRKTIPSGEKRWGVWSQTEICRNQKKKKWGRGGKVSGTLAEEKEIRSELGSDKYHPPEGQNFSTEW